MFRDLLPIFLLLVFASSVHAQFKEGEDVKEWPRVGVGFTEEQGLEAIVPLFVKLKTNSIDPKKSKVKVPFIGKDFGWGKKVKDHELKRIAKAKANVVKESGWTGWVKSPSKSHPGKDATLGKVKTGIAYLAAGDAGAVSETNFQNAGRMWIEWTKTVDGKKVKGEFLLFLRETTDKKWQMDPFGLKNMVSDQFGIGPEAAFEVFKLLKPTSTMQRLYLAYLVGKLFKAVPYAWWEGEAYADTLLKEHEGISTPFFSHFLMGENAAVLKRATWLYCYVYGVKTPKAPLEEVEGCGLLMPEAAKRAKKLLEDRKAITIIHLRNLKSSKIKALLKAEKALLEEEED